MIDFSNDVIGEHNGSYLKYLSVIQDVITRMNRNSFQLKGWSITIVATLVAFAANNGNLLLLFVAAFSTIPFCFLDAYYLLMERQFRGLYADVVNGCPNIKLFSMPINRYTRKEAIDAKDKRKYAYWRVLRSRTVLGLYGSMFLLCIVGWWVCHYSCIRQNASLEKAFRLRHAPIDFSVPRYSELKDKNFEVRKSGEESFRWEYKWK